MCCPVMLASPAPLCMCHVCGVVSVQIRKLEFLLADALAAGSDCVITLGGIQSNHARATAVAARMVGLDSYLVLRHDSPDADPGLEGNLLFDRLMGA